MQKFTKNTTKKKLVIPYDVLGPSGFQRGEPVEIRAMTDAAVILKPEMNAMEVIHVMDGLQRLVQELHICLLESCDPCDGADHCVESEDGICPYTPPAGNILRPDVQREAGIPEGVKLCAWVNEGSNTVTVAQADYRYDLTDVPKWALTSLAVMGLCLGSLEERLMSEDAVYGVKGGGNCGEGRTPL